MLRTPRITARDSGSAQSSILHRNRGVPFQSAAASPVLHNFGMFSGSHHRSQHLQAELERCASTACTLPCLWLYQPCSRAVLCTGESPTHYLFLLPASIGRLLAKRLNVAKNRGHKKNILGISNLEQFWYYSNTSSKTFPNTFMYVNDALRNIFNISEVSMILFLPM